MDFPRLLSYVMWNNVNVSYNHCIITDTWYMELEVFTSDGFVVKTRSKMLLFLVG